MCVGGCEGVRDVRAGPSIQGEGGEWEGMCEEGVGDVRAWPASQPSGGVLGETMPRD